VLLRGLDTTLSYFGLYAFEPVEEAYYRNGGIHLGKLRVSPRRVNWQSFRIAVPEVYPSGKRFKGWMVGVSANFRLYHLQEVARVIEASGVPWIGFQKATGAKWIDKEGLLMAANTKGSRIAV